MTAGELIAVVDAIKENDVSDEIKLGWIGEAEARVKCEICGVDARELDEKLSGDHALSVPMPYARLYTMYLLSMLCFLGGEYEAYNKALGEYEQAHREYGKYYIRNRRK